MSESDAVTDLSALEDGKTYVFYAVNLQKYIQMGHNQADLGNGHLANASTLSADDENSGLSVFTFHKEDGDNTYSFESACSGYYIQTVVDGASYLNTTKAKFVIQANPSVAGWFRIKNQSNDLSFNMQPTQFCGWKSDGDNQWYQIRPASVSDETVSYVKTTTNFKLGTITLNPTVAWVKNGMQVADYLATLDKCSFYTITGTGTISENNREFNCEVTESNVPVEFGKCYRLQTRYSQDAFKNQAFIKVAMEGNEEVLKCNATFTESSIADYDDFSNSLWCIERSGLGVKLRNKGTGKYMKSNGTGAAATMDANGTEFYMNEGITSGSNFTLYANSAYFGSHQGIGNTQPNPRMRLWDGGNDLDNAKRDPGSNFTFVDVDASSDVLAIGKSALKKQFTVTASAASANYLTFDVSEYQAKVNEVDAKTNLAELDALSSSVVYGAPNPDAYYRIKSVGSAEGKAYLTTEDMFVGKDGRLNTSYNGGAAYDGESLNRNITRSASDGAFVPQIWKFVSTGNNTYKVLNANTQRYIAFFNGTTLDMPIAEDYSVGINLKASTAKFEGSDNSMWQIAWGNVVMGTTGATGFGKNDQATTSDKSKIWQLEKVTSVPVSISDVNYASVALPFAVKVDESEGVEAYYVKDINDGEMLLTAFDNGIIPANTGAILYHNGATTAHLALVTTDNQVEGNKLQPVTARRLGYTARTTYVLAKNSSDEAAFLLNSLTKIPANKAYVDASSVSGAAIQSVLSFQFGETTGLDDAAISNPVNRETYYDLNGRVVLYPHNGIFVNSKGQKVLIK